MNQWTAKDMPMTKASINLTRACNLKCDYCFTYGCRSGDLSKDMGRRIIDFIFKEAEKAEKPIEKDVSLSWWGGEPLLKWNLMKELTIYAEKTKPIGVNLNFGGTTNGTLLTPDKLDWLDEHKTMFLISLDGTEATHNLYRKFHDGRGSHATIMKNMEAVLKKWPNIKPRQSLMAERVDHFFEDCKYLFDFGFDHTLFSSVYEGDWTPELWKTFVEQGKMVIDYMKTLRVQGRKPTIEHFNSYCRKDNSKWPCGAGRFYVGFDIDGAIYPCHRFNKFNDNRPWQEKEVCIGHIDNGITRPEFRQSFIDFKPQCGECLRTTDTPCHGGCFATNFDLTGSIITPSPKLCGYVNAQKEISEYLKQELGDPYMKEMEPCTCYNMCYAENTPEQIMNIDPSTDATCLCYNTQYSGPSYEDNPTIARPISEKKPMCPEPQITDQQALTGILEHILRRLTILDERMAKIEASDK